MLPDFEPENPQLARKGLLIVAAIVVVGGGGRPHLGVAVMEGRPDYDVGDLVVCVEMPKDYHDFGWAVLGGIYCVSEMEYVSDAAFEMDGDDPWWSIQLQSDPHYSTDFGFNAICFRKVDGPPEFFARMLRETQPVREKEEVQ